jgi:hypothetical protein
MTTTIKHYAKIAANNIVVDIMVTDEDYIKTVFGEWLETTHGAIGGFVYDVNGVTDTPVVRKNYAGIGYTYDRNRDVFIPPNKYPSWIFNEETCRYDPPTPVPDGDKEYKWDEESLSWI